MRDRAACSVLEPADRAALARAGRLRDLRQGETLFAAGEENTACATLVEGALKVVSTDEEGNERILALIHPAGFIGELFAPFTQHDVVALTKSRVCTFARTDLDAALSRHPQLGRALLRRSQEALHESRELMALTARRDAGERVATLLYSFAEAASDSPCHPAAQFELPLKRSEMAQLLNLTVETVSRNLTRLEGAGLIRRRGARGIELRDPARLAQLAGAVA